MLRLLLFPVDSMMQAVPNICRHMLQGLQMPFQKLADKYRDVKFVKVGYYFSHLHTVRCTYAIMYLGCNRLVSCSNS